MIAHELARSTQCGTLISSIVASVAGEITMLAEMARWARRFIGLGGSNEEECAGLAGLEGPWCYRIVAPIAAILIQMAISCA